MCVEVMECVCRGDAVCVQRDDGVCRSQQHAVMHDGCSSLTESLVAVSASVLQFFMILSMS